ncbi:MAG TPA: right-handed parallel beta-helix repeat-containing protein, partial [Chitinophagales bacterium]|nr:right-handed parallel beta-helix repeat-containing protein [Chitinophagales bacterium]
PTDPGIVVLHNGATIENAVTAISTQRRGGYFPDHYGGIIYAQNSQFTNNRKAVELMQYKPDNYSRFTNCQITANTNHNIAFEGITVWDCSNIVIDHCTFENNNPDIYALSAAITTHDAERLQIINDCRFTDVAKGIILQATNAGLGNALIKGNTFTNCRLGIQNFETREMNVEGNTFTTNTPTAQHITLSGNCGYKISENAFVNGAAAVAAFFTSLLTPGYNLINCNTFQNCGTGVYANNNNSGLHFQNNDFATLNTDVQLDNNGILPNQGSDDGFGNFLPYFNFFSLTNPTSRITTTSVTNPFIYYYPTNPNFSANAANRLVPHCFVDEIPPFPGCGTTYNYIGIEIDVPDNFIYMGCLDLYLPGMPPPDEDCKTRACLDSLKLLIGNLETQKDGGNKEALLNDLYSSPEALETYQKYLDASPYLTDEVLAEAAENPLLSPTRKANILLANAPLSNNMMNTAYQHVSPTVYQMLYAIKHYLKISDRDRLDMRIGTEVQKKEALFTQLYSQYLHNNHTDSLHSLLIAENTLFAQRCRLTNLTRQGNFADALTLLNSLPATTPDEQDYKTVQQINLQFQSATETFELSQTQFQTLHSIADAYGTQAPAAQALLNLLHGEQFEWLVPTGSEKTTPMPYP